LACTLQGKYPVNEELATNLAALNLQIKYSEHDPSKDVINSGSLEEFVPKDLIESLNLSNNQLQSWADTIKLCWISLSGTSAIEAKHIYLRYMREWKFYGSSIFIVEQRKKPKKVLLAITREGISILNFYSCEKEVIEEYHWKIISNWRFEPEKSFYFSAGSLAKPVKLTFLYPHPESISITIENFVTMIVEERKRKVISNAQERIRGVQTMRTGRKMSRQGSLQKIPSFHVN